MAKTANKKTETSTARKEDAGERPATRERQDTHITYAHDTIHIPCTQCNTTKNNPTMHTNTAPQCYPLPPKQVCDIYSLFILCLSDACVFFHVVMYIAVERLVSSLERLCLLGLRISTPSTTGATSIGKLKHNAICMHSHTRFRIRKLSKYICDIYSWRIFDMSDVYVCLHEAMFAVERLVSSLVILCLLGLCLWGLHLDTGATAYTLATAYEGATAYTLATAYEGKQLHWLLALGPIACIHEIHLMYRIDFWPIPTEALNLAYPRLLRRAARSELKKEQC